MIIYNLMFPGSFFSCFICCWWALLQSYSWGIKSVWGTCSRHTAKYWGELLLFLHWDATWEFSNMLMILLPRVTVLISSPMFIPYIMPSCRAWQIKIKIRLVELCIESYYLLHLDFLTMRLLQEVKECAISCMGLVVSAFGDNLKVELPTCLPVLVDRMGNEITRLTAVKVGLKGLTYESQFLGMIFSSRP